MNRLRSQITLSAPGRVRWVRFVLEMVQLAARASAIDWHRRRTRQELQALCDETLRDIGLRREEIGSVAAEATGHTERTRRRIVGVHGERLR